MPAFQNLATHLVAEIPVARLQLLLKREPGNQLASFEGVLCGGGCSGKDGAFCGSGCRPQQGAPDVIDRDGQLGLTAKDLSDIRNDLPALRRAVVEQVDWHLARLR